MPVTGGRPTSPPASNLATDTEVAAAVGKSSGVSVQDHGAVGDGVTDDSAAIRQAAAEAATNGDDLYFPEGTYLISRSGVTAYCLAHPGGRWYGPGTLYMPSAGDTQVRMVSIGVDGSTVDGLTFDGSSGTQGASSDQRHAIIVSDCDGTVIRNCTIDDCDGDGILIHDTATNVTVSGCVITNNRRNGISVTGSGVSNVLVHGCTITGNDSTAIDGECDSGHADHVRIVGNYLSASTSAGMALATSGAGDANRNVGWLISSNSITGTVHLEFSDSARLIGNYITKTGDTYEAVACSRTVNAIVACNRIVATGTKSAVYAAFVTSYAAPSNLQITSNEITCAAKGIELRGASRVIISGNTLLASAAAGEGIYFQATTTVEGVLINDNIIQDFDTNAIIVATYQTNTIDGLAVRGNAYIDTGGGDMTRGLRLEGTASQYAEVSYGGNVLVGVGTRVSDNTVGGPVTTTEG